MSSATATAATVDRPSTGIRLLTPEEWPKLFEMYAQNFPGRTIPLPPAASVAVLEVDGEIKAALFLTMAYHMEPGMAEHGYGHSFKDLARFLESQLQRVLADEEVLTYYVTLPDTPSVVEGWVAEIGAEQMTGYVPLTKTISKETIK